MKRELWAWGTFIPLFISGVLGVAMWPPPYLEMYETIIRWSTIESGIYGNGFRVACALVGVALWFTPWHRVRAFGCAIAAICSAFIALSFVHVGNGGIAGVWFGVMLPGTVATLRERHP